MACFRILRVGNSGFNFSSYGYNYIAPAWPLHEGEPALLRDNPSEVLGDLMLEEVISAVENIIKTSAGNHDIAKRPIIIAHSVGGLLTQIFFNENLPSFGVPIRSVAPNMMMTFDWPFFKNVAN